MDVSQPVRRTALSTLVAIVITPGEAFEEIRHRPTWGWALAITIVLAAAGSLLGTPAAKHMIETSFAAQFANDPRFAGLSPDEARARVAQLVATAVAFANFVWLLSIVYVPGVTAIEAGVLFGVRAFARSEATFAQLFSLAAHVQFIALGIGSVVLGTVVALRPIESYRTQSDFLGSLPSFAWLTPGAPPKITAFLAALGPFQVWATIVLALGLVAVARLRPPLAWSAAIVLLLFGAVWSAVFAR